MTTYAYLFIISAVWTFQLIPTLMCVLIALGFLGMLVQNRLVVRRVRKRLDETNFTGKMMEQAVQISASNVVRFSIRDGFIVQLYGDIFPERIISAEEWKAHLHPDESEEVIRRFRRMIAGKVLRDEFFYRWNFDFNGEQPLWGYMHNVSVVELQPGTNVPQSIISTLHDETELREQELREEELTDKYRQVFEHSIMQTRACPPPSREEPMLAKPT